MLRIEAKIVLQYEDERKAEAIARAVSPDNVEYPDKLSIETFNENCHVLTLINCKGEIGTFIATVDDLLRCIVLAEKTVNLAGKTQ